MEVAQRDPVGAINKLISQGDFKVAYELFVALRPSAQNAYIFQRQLIKSMIKWGDFGGTRVFYRQCINPSDEEYAGIEKLIAERAQGVFVVVFVSFTLSSEMKHEAEAKAAVHGEANVVRRPSVVVESKRNSLSVDTQGMELQAERAPVTSIHRTRSLTAAIDNFVPLGGSAPAAAAEPVSADGSHASDEGINYAVSARSV